MSDFTYSFDQLQQMAAKDNDKNLRIQCVFLGYDDVLLGGYTGLQNNTIIVFVKVHNSGRHHIVFYGYYNSDKVIISLYCNI